MKEEKTSSQNEYILNLIAKAERLRSAASKLPNNPKKAKKLRKWADNLEEIAKSNETKKDRK